MIILSHRGYWKTAAEKNTDTAFHRSFDLGFGTETDVRDCDGVLMISHDMPTKKSMPLSDFLSIFASRPYPLAINIKADGLVTALKEQMAKAHVPDWFVFDMSVPDMRGYLNATVPVFARMSEVEKEPAWMDRCAGIWLDSFSETWYDAALLERLLLSQKRVCIVSSELHQRSHQALWEMIQPFSSFSNLLLCTDLPEEAASFFRMR